MPQLSARVGQDDTWRDVADPTLGHAVTYGVTASWRLERLVWDPSELRIATVDVLRRRERRRLAWYVISLYRAWRRTQNEDLGVQLDIVTDGWFSQHAVARPDDVTSTYYDRADSMVLDAVTVRRSRLSSPVTGSARTGPCRIPAGR